MLWVSFSCSFIHFFKWITVQIKSLYVNFYQTFCYSQVYFIRLPMNSVCIFMINFLTKSIQLIRFVQVFLFKSFLCFSFTIAISWLCHSGLYLSSLFCRIDSWTLLTYGWLLSSTSIHFLWILHGFCLLFQSTPSLLVFSSYFLSFVGHSNVFVSKYSPQVFPRRSWVMSVLTIESEVSFTIFSSIFKIKNLSVNKWRLDIPIFKKETIQ